MDCRKPSSGFIDNIHEDLVEADGLKVGISLIIIFFIMMIITVTIITTITIMTRWCSRAHRTSNKTKTKTLITIIIINIIIIIIIIIRWCSRAHRTATQGWMSSAAATTAIVDHCY